MTKHHIHINYTKKIYSYAKYIGSEKHKKKTFKSEYI